LTFVCGNHQLTANGDEHFEEQHVEIPMENLVVKNNQGNLKRDRNIDGLC